MAESIIAVIFAIIMIVAHIIKNIKEAAEAAKQQQRQQKPVEAEDDLVMITRPKQNKPPKVNKPPPARQPLRDTSLGYPSSLSDSAPPKRQALTKRLAPQGEGERFGVDPGTLDAANIVAPTIDPSVKPELDSITGIYEEGVQFGDRSKSAITLDIADYFARPEGIIHAVILAEVLNRPPWIESARQQSSFLTAETQRITRGAKG